MQSSALSSFFLISNFKSFLIAQSHAFSNWSRDSSTYGKWYKLWLYYIYHHITSYLTFILASNIYSARPNTGTHGKWYKFSLSYTYHHITSYLTFILASLFHLARTNSFPNTWAHGKLVSCCLSIDWYHQISCAWKWRRIPVDNFVSLNVVHLMSTYRNLCPYYFYLAWSNTRTYTRSDPRSHGEQSISMYLWTVNCAYHVSNFYPSCLSIPFSPNQLLPQHRNPHLIQLNPKQILLCPQRPLTSPIWEEEVIWLSPLCRDSRGKIELVFAKEGGLHTPLLYCCLAL